MPLSVWSGVAQVIASVPGPGRLELFAVRDAGTATPRLVIEAYDADGLVTAGEVAVWELNQAIAALLSSTTQARRLALRDDGRAHGGHLDVVAEGDAVDLVATATQGEVRAVFVTTAQALVTDLNALVRHYLALTRTSSTSRTIVLPDAMPRVAAQA